MRTDYADMHPDVLRRAHIPLTTSYLTSAAFAFGETITNQPTLQDILAEVARRVNESPLAICTRSRKHPLVTARQLCFLLARELTTHSLVEIGNMHGLGQDHSTVLHGINTIEGLISTDRRYYRHYVTALNNLKPNR